jgi:copper chaperone CopZ
MRTIISIIVVLFAGTQVFAQSPETKSVSDQKKTEKVTLKITGMTCVGCANHIHKTLSEKKGVVDNEVKYPGDIAIITYRPNEIKIEEIIHLIEKSGYKAKKLKS